MGSAVKQVTRENITNATNTYLLGTGSKLCSYFYEKIYANNAVIFFIISDNFYVLCSTIVHSSNIGMVHTVGNEVKVLLKFIQVFDSVDIKVCRY